jgi:Mlc titration factor MtfA (ptsG expression regulator)
MFEAYTRWQRRRIIARSTLDAALWRQTLAQLPFLACLTADEQERLRETVILFLHHKSIHGAGGLVLDAAMPLVIAVQACLLIMNLDIDYYAGWVEVIVYPDEFVPSMEFVDDDGVVHREQAPRAGEAWLQGPVILSWADVAPRDEGDGVNVVIHEFAHKLDMLNGDANGFPPLHAGMNRREWAAAFAQAYEDFTRRVGADEETLIDPYAVESPAEFFAVMSEAFFELPRVVAAEYPTLYAQLRLFYKQDPLARLPVLSQGLIG